MSEIMKTREKQTTDNPDYIARMMAVQAYYQISQNQQPLRTVIEEFLGHRKVVKTVEDELLGKPNSTLFKKILISLDERLAEVDEILRGHVKSPQIVVFDENQENSPEKIEKMIEPLLKAILYCGISELLSHQEIDKSLIINDYLNVSHAFYDQGQVSFVNGILDSVAKLVRS